MNWFLTHQPQHLKPKPGGTLGFLREKCSVDACFPISLFHFTSKP